MMKGTPYYGKGLSGSTGMHMLDLLHHENYFQLMHQINSNFDWKATPQGFGHWEKIYDLVETANTDFISEMAPEDHQYVVNSIIAAMESLR